MVADEPGPHWRGCGGAYAGIFIAYAGDAEGERHRGRGHAAKSWFDCLLAGGCENRKSRWVGSGDLRMLRVNHPAVQHVAERIRGLTSFGLEVSVVREINLPTIRPCKQFH